MADSNRSIDSFQPNSHKYKAEQAEKKEKKIEKVVQGQVQTRKKPLGKKMAETFLSDDVENVKGFIFFDVIVPTIKDTISNVVSSAVDMLLFGESRGHNTTRSGGKSYVSYSNYYDRGRNNSNRDTRNMRTAKHDFRDIILDSRGEAEEVLGTMVDLLVDYHEVSVADLYDLCGISNSNWTDNKYGWTDLSGACVRRARGGGYVIDLPRAEQL